jgi:hypothetical protein
MQSASKGSKACLQLRKEIPETKEDTFSFMSFFRMMLRKKGEMRASGKIAKKEDEKNGNT